MADVGFAVANPTYAGPSECVSSGPARRSWSRGRAPGRGNTLQAPHINIAIFGRGLLKQLTTRLYFADQAEATVLNVSAIHDEAGYRRVRSTLARQYDISEADPNIQVTGANLKGNRKLFLEHRMHRGVPLHAQLRSQVTTHIERLWGHDVALEEIAGD